MIEQAYNRDIWSHGNGTQAVDLVSSALATLLLLSGNGSSVYFSSPWISDFPLLNNQFRQFSALFPHLDARAEIRFGDVLVSVARRMPVRIITVDNEVSNNFGALATTARLPGCNSALRA